MISRKVIFPTTTVILKMCECITQLLISQVWFNFLSFHILWSSVIMVVAVMGLGFQRIVTRIATAVTGVSPL
jgi:hypothetical protein